jgi:hypothetical protein
MSTVRDRVREQPLPGEAEAAVRTWPVVEAALAERQPAGHRRRTPLRLAIVTALLGLALAITLSPAGAWIGDRFDSEPHPSPPAFAALPKGGSVLAISRSGAYAISPNGSTQRLGSFSQAGWSPHGKHVVGVNGRRLIAVTPTGTVKWTLAEPRRVSHPAWSTDEGFALAYLERSSLRVVAGDGDPVTNRRVRGGAAAVTPAWLPHSDRVLTYATTRGTIETVDLTTRTTLWRTGAIAARPRSLAWSRNGRRLVALTSRSVVVVDARGRVLRTVPLPGAARELALHPNGTKAAVRVTGGGEMRVLELRLDAGGAGAGPREMFQGDVEGLAWSQNGRRLLIGWRGAGQWLLLGPGDRIRPLHDVSRELGTAGGFPRVAGWCCAG